MSSLACNSKAGIVNYTCPSSGTPWWGYVLVYRFMTTTFPMLLFWSHSVCSLFVSMKPSDCSSSEHARCSSVLSSFGVDDLSLVRSGNMSNSSWLSLVIGGIHSSSDEVVQSLSIVVSVGISGSMCCGIPGLDELLFPLLPISSMSCGNIPLLPGLVEQLGWSSLWTDSCMWSSASGSLCCHCSVPRNTTHCSSHHY